jgi:hypothetical protein
MPFALREHLISDLPMIESKSVGIFARKLQVERRR